MDRVGLLVGIGTAVALALIATFAPPIAPSTAFVHVAQFGAVGVGAVLAGVTASNYDAP